MRIPFRIGISMMHPVHYCIRPGAQIGGPLGYIRKYEKEALPGFTHRKCTVRSISVIKKCL